MPIADRRQCHTSSSAEDPIDPRDLIDLLPDSFSHINYEELDIDQVVDVDFEEQSESTSITIGIDYAPYIRFSGQLLAKVEDTHNKLIPSRFSGSIGDWTQLFLYQTCKGRYICQRIKRTRRVDTSSKFEGKVCENVSEAIEFFGRSWLAIELYEGANILLTEEFATENAEA